MSLIMNGIVIRGVLTYEIDQLKNAAKEFQDYNPKIVFIVVQKKINTRIFQQSDSISNPPPGITLF